MDFFGLGFGEILLILIVTLIIFGPTRLPEMARTLGRAVRGLRQMTSNFTTAVNRELEIEEVKSHKPPVTAIKEPEPEKGGDTGAAGPGAEVPPERASGKDG